MPVGLDQTPQKHKTTGFKLTSRTRQVSHYVILGNSLPLERIRGNGDETILYVVYVLEVTNSQFPIPKKPMVPVEGGEYGLKILNFFSVPTYHSLLLFIS